MADVPAPGLREPDPGAPAPAPLTDRARPPATGRQATASPAEPAPAGGPGAGQCPRRLPGAGGRTGQGSDPGLASVGMRAGVWGVGAWLWGWAWVHRQAGGGVCRCASAVGCGGGTQGARVGVGTQTGVGGARQAGGGCVRAGQGWAHRDLEGRPLPGNCPPKIVTSREKPTGLHRVLSGGKVSGRGLFLQHSS